MTDHSAPPLNTREYRGIRRPALLASPEAPGIWCTSCSRSGSPACSSCPSSTPPFVPLPVPGVTDIMIIVMAAQHANLFLLVGITTAGSALGGYFSYKVAHSGGVAFLEKHVPQRIFKRVTGWMEHHAILAVALPGYPSAPHAALAFCARRRRAGHVAKKSS